MPLSFLPLSVFSNMARIKPDKGTETHPTIYIDDEGKKMEIQDKEDSVLALGSSRL